MGELGSTSADGASNGVAVNTEYHLSSIEHMGNRGSDIEAAHNLTSHIGQALQGGATQQQVLLSLRCLKIREPINHPVLTMLGLIDRNPRLAQGWPEGFADKIKSHFSSDPDNVHIDRPTAQRLFVDATAPMRYGSAVLGLEGQAKAMWAKFRLAAMSKINGQQQAEILGFDPSTYESS